MKKLTLLIMSVAFLAAMLITSGFAEAEKAKTEEAATEAKVEKKADKVKEATEAKVAEKEAKIEEAATEAKEDKEVEEPAIIATESGLRYQDLVVGEGKEAIDKMNVDCHYTLWLADSTGLVKGDKIDSSHDRPGSFKCQIGVRLILGWSEGMIGMKEGGTRRLLVPWKLGYGERGAGGAIPGKTNLIFEIDFLKAM